MSYEELLDLVLREIKKNEKFVRGLAFLIGDNNKINKKNPKISWTKLLDTLKRGIEQISIYFENNPRAEKLFRKKALDMVQLKSSFLGDDGRELNKKDNTVLWIVGIAVVGLAGYLIYRHFKKIEEAKLRAESLNVSSLPKMELGGDLSLNNSINESIASNPVPINNPVNLDPSYNVPAEVLTPEVTVPQMPNPNQNIASGNNIQSGFNIQVQTMNTPQQNIPQMPLNNVNNNV